ncbi:hypothetical protein GEMRC1_012241 [Eukaryota sp. GEM-RC1]
MEHNHLENIVERNFDEELTDQLPLSKERLKNNTVSPWALVKCAKCHVLWNRDFNSAINIYIIVHGTILERSKSQTTPVVDGGNTDQIPKKKTVSKGKAMRIVPTKEYVCDIQVTLVLSKG